MARLIDVDALDIRVLNPLATDKPEYAHGWNCAIEMVVKAPPVDAVEVVRCKKCRHYNQSGCSKGFGWCENLGIGRNDNNFCNTGEMTEAECTLDNISEVLAFQK